MSVEHANCSQRVNGSCVGGFLTSRVISSVFCSQSAACVQLMRHFVRSTLSSVGFALQLTMIVEFFLRLSFSCNAPTSIVLLTPKVVQSVGGGVPQTIDSVSALPVFDCIPKAISSFPSIYYISVDD